MTFLSQLRIGPRLALGFGLLVSLIVIQAVLTWTQLRGIDHAVSQVVDDRYPKILLTASIRDAVNIQVRYLRGAALAAITGDRRILDESLAKVAETAQANGQNIDTLRRMINTPRGKELFEAVNQARSQFAALRDKSIAALRNGDAIAGANLIMTEVREAQTRYESALQAFADFQQGLMRDSGTQAKERIEQVGLVSWGVTAAVVCLALLAAWGITRSIVTPIGEAVTVAQAVAAGDLRIRPRAASRDETGTLLDALSEMTRKLSTLVSSVRHGSESVATASSQIAQGNQDLSSRTEEQASALQQTATTMEQLGSTVRNNAENARQASALAQEAAEVAVRGGEVVGQVVATMQGISDSSRRIGDIIGTIDGIAFQTNILALNAAVEAARAGEQGRGFAVVASEVRTLAQRSADAAKEIKDLIGRNVGQVEQGAALVERAGRTMDDVVGSIQRVSQIAGQISLATQEQSGGVQQVGQAVTQMDQVTQQNAALVEESAAAAASLNSQAQDLVRAVSVFQVAA